MTFLRQRVVGKIVTLQEGEAVTALLMQLYSRGVGRLPRSWVIPVT